MNILRKLFSWWPRIHQYTTRGDIEVTNDFSFTQYICTCCEKTTGLDPWQIRDMPASMARCSFGKPANLKELLGLLFESVNCFKK